MQFDDYPRPSLAVDPAVVTVSGGQVQCVLWKRNTEPFLGAWALPGVFVNEGESLEGAVARGVHGKLGLSREVSPIQLLTWNVPGRDSRGWVVTVAYLVPMPFTSMSHGIEGNGDCEVFTVRHTKSHDEPTIWVNSDGERVKLAFDHERILRAVLTHVQERLWTTDIVLRLMPNQFTLRDLQAAYEAVLGHSLNKDSFRRRVVRTQELVVPQGGLERGVDHRPAELYARNPAFAAPYAE